MPKQSQRKRLTLMHARLTQEVRDHQHRLACIEEQIAKDVTRLSEPEIRANEIISVIPITAARDANLSPRQPLNQTMTPEELETRMQRLLQDRETAAQALSRTNGIRAGVQVALDRLPQQMRQQPHHGGTEGIER